MSTTRPRRSGSSSSSAARISSSRSTDLTPWASTQANLPAGPSVDGQHLRPLSQGSYRSCHSIGVLIPTRQTDDLEACARLGSVVHAADGYPAYLNRDIRDFIGSP